jgi:hypothetical protein
VGLVEWLKVYAKKIKIKINKYFRHPKNKENKYQMGA